MHDLALYVIRRLAAHGHRALLAGGCVRDKILGRPPKDYDVATSARPEEVQALFERTVLTGARFGVVQVVGDGAQVEVATFRRESGYADGRHPDEVDFTDEREDALRRDFTVNGLFEDPLSGRVLDYVGGRDDIRARVIRAIGDPMARFREDHLRMVRAARFAVQLGFEIEPATAEAARAMAALASKVSGERVQGEMAGIILSADPARGIRLLDDLGLLAILLPEVAREKGVPQPANFHPEGDVFVHTCLVMGALRPPRGADRVAFPLAMATLLHDVGKPATIEFADRIRFNCHEHVGEDAARAICERLRLSSADTEAIAWLVRKHLVLKDAAGMKDSTLKRLSVHPLFQDLVALTRADTMGSHGDLAYVDAVQARVDAWPPEAVRPPRLVTGQDLIAMGLIPGPFFGEILADVAERQLGGELADREAALAYVRTRSGGR